jgi:sugar/nucleoside kinase (ribokinase family)
MMARFFVAGLINVETTVAIDGFPLDYFPVRYPFYGLHTAVSGVGWNIARALTTLGDSVDFASLIGGDANGQLARQGLALAGIHDGLVLEALEATAQSVILYDPHGQRQIHVDLKDIQSQAYPTHLAEGAIRHCDLAVICNINFARPLLAIAQEAGKPIATDVHALSDLEDDYNGAFIKAATILFMSDESLPDTPETVANDLLRRFEVAIVVIGLGEQGALLAVRADDFFGRFPAVRTRPVINTIGAGDALFSAFLDRYMRTGNPYAALRAAQVFASYKIGAKGAAEGFLTPGELNVWIAQTSEEA